MKFIKNDLVEEIRNDLWEFQIGNERDLETAYCFHLRNFLGNDKTWKISTNHTISGKATSITKISTSGKRKRSGFIMPDITIAINPKEYNKGLKHKIGIELKLTNPSTKKFPNISSEIFKRDFRKLKKIKTKGYMRTTLFFLVYSDPTVKELNARKQIRNVQRWVSGGKGKFEVRTINRCINPKTKKIIDTGKQDERRQKLRRIYRSYTNGDPRFKQKQSKNATNNSSQKKSWKTMRKRVQNPSWRRKNPNHPLTKKYKKENLN